MLRTVRYCLVAAAFGAAATAQAQTQLLQTLNVSPPALQVQALAPQLVAFAGGDVNFQNLVNGLAFGLPVTLTTPVAVGVTQVVSFTPGGTMAPAQIAQTLETARQAGIANGIATPTAQQISILLNGGALPTATGTAAVNGLINSPSTVSTAIATPATGTSNGAPSPAAQLQQTPRFSRSESPVPRGVADTPFTGSTTASPAAATAAGTSPAGTAATGGTTASTPGAAVAGGLVRPATAGAPGVPRFAAGR